LVLSSALISELTMAAIIQSFLYVARFSKI
jgi:hypothetical protein